MKKTILPSLAALAALAPMAASASDGLLTFNGMVTATTCVINGGLPDFTRILPQISASALPAANSTAGTTNFSIVLTSCTPTTGSVIALFQPGVGVDPVTGRLNNGGSAANVQIQLLNSAGGIIFAGAPLATQNSGAAVPLVDGAATLNYAARYFANGGGVGSGTVEAKVTYSIEYQ